MSYRNAFAVVVGIGQYAHLRPLAKAANDAKCVYETLVDKAYCGYEAENVKLLLDETATKDALEEDLGWLASQTRQDSTVMFFFAGHGGQNPTSPLKDNYLLPYDCDPFEGGKLSIDKLAQNSLTSNEFTEALKKINCQKLVVMFDCCHSGGIGDVKRDPFEASDQMRAGLSEDYYERLARGKGRVILASCLPGEFSWERAAMPNGIFTAHLLAGLRGRAAVRDDGLIRVFDLFHDLSQHVPKDAEKIWDKDTQDWASQHPLFKGELQDNFPVALAHGGSRGHLESTSIPSPLTTPGSPSDQLKQIRKLIISNPVAGIGRLELYLEDKAQWVDERDALGLRKGDIEKADKQERLLGVISPKLEFEKRAAIFFALSVCRDLEADSHSVS